jgi:hypothetical protein
MAGTWAPYTGAESILLTTLLFLDRCRFRIPRREDSIFPGADESSVNTANQWCLN